MTLGRFLLGILLAFVAFGPAALGMAAVRRHLLPAWRGTEALLVDLVLVLSLVTVVGELLGTVGWFRTEALVVALGGIGSITWWLAGRRWPPPAVAPADEPDRAPPVDRRAATLAVGGLLVVAGSWIARTIMALDQGITTVDSLWYHLPVANEFARTGRVTATIVQDGDSVTAYFPFTSSLWHAVGLLLFDTDLLSAVVNLGWLGLALVAAWCIGKPLGVAPATALVAGVVLGMPAVVETQSGGALTDVVGLALLLVAIALAVQPPDAVRAEGRWVPIGLALGLATGMKLTFLVPAGALALGLVVTSAPGWRVRRLGLVVGAAAVSGAYWYLRNVVDVGNPLPALGVNLGPIRVRSIPGTLPPSTLASLLSDGDAWRDHLLPGFRDGFGSAWPVIVALALGGGVVALVRGERHVQVIGGVALASTVAFVFNPQYLFGGIFFATNLRYALPGLLLGLLVVPLVTRRWSGPVVIGLVGLLLVTQLDPVSWSIGPGGDSFFDPVGRSAAVRAAVVVVVLAGATLLAAWVVIPAWRRAGIRIATASLVVAAVLVTFGGLAAVHGRYIEGRYADTGPFNEAYAWAQDVRGTRIGVYGTYLSVKYAFAGADRSNVVRYLSVEEDDGTVRDAADCTEWRRQLVTGRYRYVVINSETPEMGTSAWTSRLPGVETVLTTSSGDASIQVYRLPTDLAPGPC